MRLLLVALLAGVGILGAQEAPPPALGFLLQALAKSADPALQVNLLRGMNKALEGRRNVAAPPEWNALAEKLAASSNAEVREQVQTLGAIFGSSSALAGMRKILADPAADRAAREKALESLLASKDRETLPVLLALVKEPGPLRAAALRGLSSADDAQIAGVVLEIYPSLESAEKREALGTLLARAASAKALIGALEAQRVPVADLSAAEVRQLRSFKEPAVEEWLRKNPALMVTSADKKAEIARYKSFLTPEFLRTGDASRGRALFTQTCALCHRLYDTGADIGPELTGANRGDLDYLLQNVLDPNAMIGKDYQNTTVETKDGRMIVGLIRGDDESALTLKTLAGPAIVPRGDIKTVTVSEVSMMPEGLLSALAPEQTRDLFAYLATTQQVAMRATPGNAGEFFNGNDLARWRQTGTEWTVDAGELVGRGNAQRPVRLLSEIIAGDFKLSAKVQLRGEHAAAEIVLRGRADQERFHGLALSFGGATPACLLNYGGDFGPDSMRTSAPMGNARWSELEVVTSGTQVRVLIDGKIAVPGVGVQGVTQTVPAFYLYGEDAELRVKDLKLEPLE